MKLSFRVNNIPSHLFVNLQRSLFLVTFGGFFVCLWTSLSPIGSDWFWVSNLIGCSYLKPTSYDKNGEKTFGQMTFGKRHFT